MYANQSTPAVITAIDGANIDTLPPVLPNITDPTLQHLRIIMPFHLSRTYIHEGVCTIQLFIHVYSCALPLFLSN